MQVVVIGLNHETTPVAIRERVAIPSEVLPQALVAVRALPGVCEAAILSTCYRTELYVVGGSDLDLDAVHQFLPRFRQVPAELITGRLYVHTGRAAVAHLCSVAAGLDSAVLGETQVLAQVKGAYEVAAANGALGPYLHQLFKLCIAAAKQVHSETAVGLQPLSVGSVVVQIVRQVFQRMDKIQVLVLGTGKMGRLAIRHLVDAGVGGITVASRAPDRAREAAAGAQGRWISFEEVPAQLGSFRVVITATTDLVLPFAQVASACLGTQVSLLLIDLGVPRNVDAAVAELPQVLLFNIDDMRRVAGMNLVSRRQELEKAFRIVERCAERYLAWAASRRVVPLIRTLTEQGERIRRQELDRARSYSRTPDQQWEAVERLTRSLTGRLLHEFIVNLKRAVPGLEGAAPSTSDAGAP